MPRAKLTKLLPWIVTPALLIVIVVGWEVVVTVFQVNPLVFPPPSAVWDSTVTLLRDGATWRAAGITATETVAGFAIAVVFGVLTGAVLGKVAWLEMSLRPLIVISQVVPKVAFIPLFVIWFGFGMTSKIVLAATLAFFPVMLNVLLGVRSVDRGQREVMKSLNATRLQTFTQLELKSVLPYLFAGMEVAIVFATIGAIVGEYLGGNQGLGFYVLSAMNALDSPQMFAVVGLLSVLGLVLYFIVNEAKRFVIPWHESVYGQRELNV